VGFNFELIEGASGRKSDMTRFICVPLILAFHAVSFAQETTISGHVLDFVRKSGIDGATIEAKVDGSASQLTVSGQDGSFRFTKVKRGKTVQITVSQLGYSPDPFTKPITTTQPNVTLEFRLIPRQATDQYLQMVAREIFSNSAQDSELLSVVEASNLPADRYGLVTGELVRLSTAASASASEPRRAIVERAERGASARLVVEEATQQSAARAKTDQARARAEAASAPATNNAQALRDRLRDQLNAILETHDSARGLIVDMSDVLFEANQSTLKPGAQEKLAGVSNILRSYPTLHLELEGHTDNVGTDDYNEKLSRRRVDAVRDYLVSSGIDPDRMRAVGLGKSQSVASNATAAGRQQNRRVEIVIDGNAIGSQNQGAVNSRR
jgi:outer membrane protein OmpA-like peptidoglycan-associated protein